MLKPASVAPPIEETAPNLTSPETRSGIYRESTPPEQVPDDVRHFDELEGRLEVRGIPRTSETVALNLYSTRSLALTDILRTLQNLGLTVAEELRSYNIRVSVLCPGSTDTELTPHTGKDQAKMLQPDDIAHVVAMLVTQTPQSFVSEISLRPTQKP